MTKNTLLCETKSIFYSSMAEVDFAIPSVQLVDVFFQGGDDILDDMDIEWLY